MTDPLQDPRAEELLTLDLGRLESIGDDIRAASREAHASAADLVTVRHDHTWHGHAATTFRASIGRLTPELGKLSHGFDEVATALLRYESAAASIKPEFARVIAALQAAQTKVGPAQAAYDAASKALRKAANDLTSSIATLEKDELAVIHTQNALGSAHGDVEALRKRAFELLDEFEHHRHGCRLAIAAARSAAPHRTTHTGSGVTTIGGVSGAGHHHTNPPHTHGGTPNGGAHGAVPPKVRTMIDKAKSLLGTPYVWGGGHAGFGGKSGLDCSGFVSTVLHSAGYLAAPVTTQGFASQPGIVRGRGRWVTIYDRTAGPADDEHVIIELNGQFYEEGGGSGSGGRPDVHAFTPSPEYLASFNEVLHPEGL